MRMMSRVLAVSLIATSISGVAMTSAAQAAVPGCVTTSAYNSGIFHYVTAYNGCSSTQRFRMIWSNAVDGSCLSLAPGHSRTESRGQQAAVSELRSC